jgi:hypothetical protein
MLTIYNGFSGSTYEVRLGANRIDTTESGSVVVTSRSSIVHSQYDSNTINNDIAVVRLPSAVSLTSKCYSIMINITVRFLSLKSYL